MPLIQPDILDRIAALEADLAALKAAGGNGLSGTDQSIKGSHDRLDNLLGAAGAGGVLYLNLASGDPKVVLQIGGTAKFAIGADDSDADALVICSGDTLGTTNRLRIGSDGIVSIPGDLRKTASDVTVGAYVRAEKNVTGWFYKTITAGTGGTGTIAKASLTSTSETPIAYKVVGYMADTTLGAFTAARLILKATSSGATNVLAVPQVASKYIHFSGTVNAHTDGTIYYDVTNVGDFYCYLTVVGYYL
jgi:hypothetical protein